MNKQELLDKIASRDLVCGTVGLGYVGLPLAVEKARRLQDGGHRCAGREGRHGQSQARTTSATW